MNFELGKDSFSSLFPFFVAFGPDSIIEATGPSFQRLLGHDPVGEPLDGLFACRTPSATLTCESIRDYPGELFVLDLKAKQISFRGQMCCMDRGGCFAGAPWILDEKDLEQAGLGLEDFAINDPIGELFTAFRAQKAALHQTHQLSEMLKERNERLDMFAASLAHDIRNPLSVIQTGTEFLQGSDLDLDLPEKVMSLIKAIHQSSRKANEIVSALLLLANSNPGGVEKVPTKMEDLVRDCIRSFQSVIEEKNAQITVESLEDCSTHTPWVQRIFDNYISNALKYGGTPPNLRIRSEARRTRFGPALRYWFEDNGPGIPRDRQDEVFRAFKRLEPDRAEGTGLGLSMAKRIAESMDGSVGVESEPGKGSRFYLELPA